MPAQSRKQQKWAFGAKGEKWAREHHFDEVRAEKRPKKRRKK